MPAISFKKQFAGMILDGSKRHTVRVRRKRNPIYAGYTLFLYTGMRTKDCQRLMKTECAAVVPIAIFPDALRIVMNGKRLTLDEVVNFSIRDGFTNPGEFFDFFRQYPPQVREHELEVIYWRYDHGQDSGE
jgi:hypothetical protein